MTLSAGNRPVCHPVHIGAEIEALVARAIHQTSSQSSTIANDHLTQRCAEMMAEFGAGVDFDWGPAWSGCEEG